MGKFAFESLLFIFNYPNAIIANGEVSWNAWNFSSNESLLAILLILINVQISIEGKVARSASCWRLRTLIAHF